MAVFTKYLAFTCVLTLSGCALNQSVESSNYVEEVESIVTTSSISLYIYPKTKAVNNDVKSGYFVEFDLADKSDIPTIKYQD
ncbi:hypothetical protein [Neptuniibacter sp. QD34_54]|uniref:hypothetical protein n=1 Tax=Neptuniibacter sp. QD34_54 TaxID=3398208 RepID=UPI0039F62DDA